MADHEARCRDPGRHRRRRQEALPGEPPWNDARLADLGETVEIELRRSGVGRRHQFVEAVDVGADRHQDHRSGPEASTARGNTRRFSGHCTMNRWANG